MKEERRKKMEEMARLRTDVELMDRHLTKKQRKENPKRREMMERYALLREEVENIDRHDPEILMEREKEAGSLMLRMAIGFAAASVIYWLVYHLVPGAAPIMDKTIIVGWGFPLLAMMGLLGFALSRTSPLERS